MNLQLEEAGQMKMKKIKLRKLILFLEIRSLIFCLIFDPINDQICYWNLLRNILLDFIFPMSRPGPHLVKYNSIYELPKLMSQIWHKYGNSV